jgi:hypothetical protein
MYTQVFSSTQVKFRMPPAGPGNLCGHVAAGMARFQEQYRHRQHRLGAPGYAAVKSFLDRRYQGAVELQETGFYRIFWQGILDGANQLQIFIDAFQVSTSVTHK